MYIFNINLVLFISFNTLFFAEMKNSKKPKNEI